MTEGHRSVSHQSVKHVGVSRARGVRRAGHALGQVTRAVERVCVGPLLKRLLPVKEDQLQGHRTILGGDEQALRFPPFLLNCSLSPRNNSFITIIATLLVLK